MNIMLLGFTIFWLCFLACIIIIVRKRIKEINDQKLVMHVRQVLKAHEKQLKHLPEKSLAEEVNLLALKYGISAATLWAAIREVRKNDSLVVNDEDRLYRETFGVDEPDRDVYLYDYEQEEQEDYEHDELLEHLEEEVCDEDLGDEDSSQDSDDPWSSHDSWSSHDTFDSHDDFGYVD